MDDTWKIAVWQQLGAAIDTLERAIISCPDGLWSGRSRQPEYWYVAYHTLFWLDFYLSESPEGFAPPEPFGPEEMDPSGILPPRVYTKEELIRYLRHGHEKGRQAVASLTEEQARERRVFGNANLTVAEKFLYVMRHVQHHAAQLNLILRQTTDSAPRWVFTAKNPLNR